MLEEGSFYELNNISQLSLDDMIINARETDHCAFSDYLSKQGGGFAGKYPAIYKYLRNSTFFYEKEFPAIQNCIKREKRQLLFETPSRINVSIELSLELDEAGTIETGPQYLFNVKDKLNWLMIYQNGKHITVASRYIVQKFITRILGKEIKALQKESGISETEIIHALYDTSEGDPCFIMFEKPKDENKSIIIDLRYYDSVHHKKEQIEIKEKSTPLYEQSIRYRFRALKENCSNWLYVRAPKDFAIELSESNSGFVLLQSQDEEIKALYRKAGNKRCDEDIEINVRVLKSLRNWFLGIYRFATIVCSICILIVLLRVLALSVPFDVPVFSADSMKGLTPVLISLVAAVIATRGWLMHEEHVLLPIGKKYIELVIGLIILAALLILLSYPLPLHYCILMITEWFSSMIDVIFSKLNSLV